MEPLAKAKTGLEAVEFPQFKLEESKQFATPEETGFGLEAVKFPKPFGEESVSQREENGELPWYADLALAGGIYAGTAAVLGATTGVGVLGTTAVAAPLYMAAKYALTGHTPKPALTSFIPGVNELPETAQTILGAAEEEALWLVGGPAIKGSGKLIKGLAKGVDKVTHGALKPIVNAIEPAGEWAWNKIAVPTVTKGPLQAAAGGSVIGAGVGAVVADDKLEGALTGAVLGAGIMGGAALGTKQFLKKNLAETLQPAIERLEKKLPPAAEAFRRVQIESSLVKDVGRDLGKKLQVEMPQTQFAVGKALKTDAALRDIKNVRAKELVSEFRSKVDINMDKKYRDHFYEQLSKALPMHVKLSEKGMKTFYQPEGTSIKQVLGSLKEIIESPLSSVKDVTIAKDLYNLPAMVPMDVAKASRAASMEVLFSKLKAMPGVVSDKIKPGYVESTVSAFKGAIIHRDVELELQAMEKLPKIAEGMYQKYFMAPWKTNKVILRPASHIRNLMSNLVLNDWGGLPFYRTDIYIDAYKGMKGNTAAWKEFQKMTGLSRMQFTDAEINQLASGFSPKGYFKSIGSGSGLTYESNILDRAMNVYDKIVAPARSLYSAEESLFKYAKYLHNIEKGIGKKEAAFDAIKWTFNFGEVTPEIATIGKYFMPFVRWFSKSIPLGLETAVKHPLRMGKWFAFYQAFQANAMQSTKIDGDEWARIHDGLPEYMQKGMYLLMPWRNDKGQLNLLDMTYIVPFVGDVSQLYQTASPVEAVFQNPVFTIPAALISKRKFSGVPLYYDWEDPSTKFAKAAAYGWEQLMPASMPGGTDWRKLQNAFTEQEGAMSVEAALASASGFKLTPVDEIGNMRRKRAIMKVYDREIKAFTKKEIMKTKSDEDQQKVIEQSIKLRQQIRGVK